MLKRQGLHFHFRRVVPKPLRPLVGQREFWASLATSSATVARGRAGRLYALTEEILTLAERIRDALPPPVPANFDDPEAEIQALDAAIIDDLEATLELERRKSKMRENILEMRLLSDQARHYQALNRRVEDAQAKLPQRCRASSERRARSLRRDDPARTRSRWRQALLPR